VDCYFEDVILTYKTLISHWPVFTTEGIAEFSNCLQRLFLTPKSKFKKTEFVWFQKFHVGKNTLDKTVRTLVEGTPGINLEGRTFSDKIPRRIGISQMEEGLVTVEKGMMITGH
jgi:hypothetical protein